MRTAACLFALVLLASPAVAKRHHQATEPGGASVKDLVISTRCAIARAGAEMKANGYIISGFKGKLTLTNVHGVTRSASAKGAFDAGLISLSAEGGTSVGLTNTSLRNIYFTYLPGHAVPAVCNRIAIRVYDRRLRPLKQWAGDELDTTALHDPTSGGDQTYTGVLQIQDTSKAGFHLKIAFLSLDIGGESGATHTRSTEYNFAFTFGLNPSEAMHSDLPLPPDDIPVRFAKAPAS